MKRSAREEGGKDEEKKEKKKKMNIKTVKWKIKIMKIESGDKKKGE